MNSYSGFSETSRRNTGNISDRVSSIGDDAAIPLAKIHTRVLREQIHGLEDINLLQFRMFYSSTLKHRDPSLILSLQFTMS